MPPVYDQGQLGSCTGNAIAGALEYEEMIQGQGQVTPSRLFIYYEERVIEDSVEWDAGAEIRDGIKVVAKKGAPPEHVWPYDIDRFRDKPSVEAYNEALQHEAIEYARLSPNGSIRATLASGKPVVFGFTVYENFESDEAARTGIIKMPALDEGVLGGHAVLAIGYDNHRKLIECRNSWGPEWGDNGYFWLPFGYFTTGQNSLASDIWVIKRTT